MSSYCISVEVYFKEVVIVRHAFLSIFKCFYLSLYKPNVLSLWLDSDLDSCDLAITSLKNNVDNFIGPIVPFFMIDGTFGWAYVGVNRMSWTVPLLKSPAQAWHEKNTLLLNTVDHWQPYSLCILCCVYKVGLYGLFVCWLHLFLYPELVFPHLPQRSREPNICWACSPISFRGSKGTERPVNWNASNIYLLRSQRTACLKSVIFI